MKEPFDMFKGLGNLGNIASMMGSLQQLPDRMRELNDRMKDESVSASSAGGSVEVVMNGTGEVQSVRISDESLAGSELESAIVEATNAAGAAAKKLYAESITNMVDDMDLKLPGLDSVISTLTGGN
ncbi:YbaB/EbfC family nucleoid-associated protein [Rubripirellula lacrimiformis]|nr:YbaB/EbfC family nucleoid-associated protein [Rubripirellula lacrimiformis]